MDALIRNAQYGMRALLAREDSPLSPSVHSIRDPHQYRDLRVTFPSEKISITRKGREQKGHKKGTKTSLSGSSMVSLKPAQLLWNE